MISVIISTIGRPSIYETLESISKGSYRDYEIILISQGISLDKKKFPKKVRYFEMDKKNISIGRNFGVSKAKGDIIAFTDDDCLADKNWLQEIHNSYKKYKDIDATFGQVIPYKEDKYPGMYCPCSIKKREEIITKPMFHSVYIGHGNNFSLKKASLDHFGGFKPWVGTGAIALSAEDAELVLRILIMKGKVLSGNKGIIYHNRWLTSEQHRKLMFGYVCGELACYGYLAFQGNPLGKKVLDKHAREFREKLIMVLRCIRHPFRYDMYTMKYEFFYHLQFEIYILRGLLIGWYYSITDPIPRSLK